MARLSTRVARLSARLDPALDPQFLAFARAVIAWGYQVPTEERARERAFAQQRTGRGATWTALVALAEEEADEAPVVDPPRLTPAEQEEADRVAGKVEARGLAALSDANLDLAACLRR